MCARCCKHAFAAAVGQRLQIIRAEELTAADGLNILEKAMQPFIRLTSPFVTLPVNDIDTDQIMRPDFKRYR
jgi:hypothetical protein